MEEALVDRGSWLSSKTTSRSPLDMTKHVELIHLRFTMIWCFLLHGTALLPFILRVWNWKSLSFLKGYVKEKTVRKWRGRLAESNFCRYIPESMPQLYFWDSIKMNCHRILFSSNETIEREKILHIPMSRSTLLRHPNQPLKKAPPMNNHKEKIRMSFSETRQGVEFN